MLEAIINDITSEKNQGHQAKPMLIFQREIMLDQLIGVFSRKMFSG